MSDTIIAINNKVLVLILETQIREVLTLQLNTLLWVFHILIFLLRRRISIFNFLISFLILNFWFLYFAFNFAKIKFKLLIIYCCRFLKIILININIFILLFQSVNARVYVYLMRRLRFVHHMWPILFSIMRL